MLLTARKRVAQNSFSWVDRIAILCTSLTVVAAGLPLVVSRTCRIRTWLCAAIILEIPIQLDTYLYYQQDRAAVAGLNLSLSSICLVLIYLSWTIDHLARFGRNRDGMLSVHLPAILYLVAVSISVLMARAVDLAAFELFLLTQAFLIYLYLSNGIDQRMDVVLLIVVLAVGLLAQSILMVWTWVAGGPFALPGTKLFALSDGRVGGTVGHPNAAAAFLSLCFGPVLGLLLIPLKTLYRAIGVIALFGGAVALLLTESRGGWTAATCTCVIFMGAAWRQRRLPRWAPVAALGAALVLVAGFHDAITQRLTGHQELGSAYSRVPLMKLASEMISDHTLVGVGANNFNVVSREYVTVETAGYWLSTVHNKFLLVWSETGLIGLVAFCLFLCAIVRRAWQTWRSNDPILGPLGLGVAASVIGHVLHMNVDIFQDRPSVQTLWLLAGLATAMCAMTKSRGPGQRLQKPSKTCPRPAPGGWDLRVPRTQ